MTAVISLLSRTAVSMPRFWLMYAVSQSDRRIQFNAMSSMAEDNLTTGWQGLWNCQSEWRNYTESKPGLTNNQMNIIHHFNHQYNCYWAMNDECYSKVFNQHCGRHMSCMCYNYILQCIFIDIYVLCPLTSTACSCL